MGPPTPDLNSIALTCGEPAGIASEITAKAWLALCGKNAAAFFLIGDDDYFSSRAAVAGISIATTKIAAPHEARAVFPAALPILHRPLAAHPKPGVIDPATAKGVIAAIDEGVGLVMAGKAAALVTNPIQKEALYAAGFRHQGHTDYLASLASKTGHRTHEVMMLVARDLRAVPLTVHIPFKDVLAALNAEMIATQARVVANDLQKYFGIMRPRLAFTGLNPHAGENGTMGREEQTIIIPAINQLRAEGLTVAGPLPADTAFHEEARANYDAILCMHHDQALIPVKTLDFHGGVNVTLGLPFIRTSPDHGTALGIAGTGKANPQSLIAALKLAGEMAAHVPR
ncbi:MAG: 4-hydroxythreonine-4-phosphate dehydrogenase PdxA [Aestuariivirga sp.]|nr:4-hydroxythreonine-4-phosphate dehydrogenase PdxA [Aestuariivirga sp.]